MGTLEKGVSAEVFAPEVKETLSYISTAGLHHPS